MGIILHKRERKEDRCRKKEGKVPRQKPLLHLFNSHYEGLDKIVFTESTQHQEVMSKQ